MISTAQVSSSEYDLKLSFWYHACTNSYII